MSLNRFELNEENPQLMEILSILNDLIRNSNVTGGILTHLPILRHIIPGMTGFTVLNQRLKQMSQFFKVILYAFLNVISVYTEDISHFRAKLRDTYKLEEMASLEIL